MEVEKQEKRYIWDKIDKTSSINCRLEKNIYVKFIQIRNHIVAM